MWSYWVTMLQLYYNQCCGSGMFYPGSRILLYIKRGLKNKTNLFFCSLWFQEQVFFSQKSKRTRILKKISHQKTYSLNPGSEIWNPGSGSWIQGVKKHQILDPGSRIRICNTDYNNGYIPFSLLNLVEYFFGKGSD
jgi:hypothetical protein